MVNVKNLYLVPLLLMASAFSNAQQIDVKIDQVDDFISGCVLRVNAEAITSNEVILMLNERLASQFTELVNTQDASVAQKEIVDIVVQFTTSRIQELLLYQHAYNDLNKGEQLDKQLDGMVSDYRNVYLGRLDNNRAIALEKVKNEKIDLDEIMNEYKKSQLIEFYKQATRDEAGKTTRMELLRYYEKHIDDEYTAQDAIQFQLCDIPTVENYELAKREIRKAKLLLNEGTPFDEIVKTYSKGFRKSYDGIWRPLAPESLQPLYQPIVKALDGKEDGYVSDLIEVDGHFFIAKLLSRTHAKVKDFSVAQHEIKQKFDKKAWEAYRSKTQKILYEEASFSEQALRVFAQRTTLEIYSRYKK